MPIQPDYVPTSITLTSGNPNFTVQDGLLVTRTIRPGDRIFLDAKGLELQIASVTGETTGTLTANCPATHAGPAQQCRIRYQADGDRYGAMAAQLRDWLANGNVSALAELTTSADKVPYYTGAGTASLATLTAFARTLLGNADAAAARATLGANSAANLSTGTIPNGRLPPRLMETIGSHGITDCNSLASTGFYFMLNTSSNLPAGGSHWYVLNLAQDPIQARFQIACEATSGAMKRRLIWFGAWTAWSDV